jgi:hypothetical protein
MKFKNKIATVALLFFAGSIGLTSCYESMLDYEDDNLVVGTGGTDSISSVDLGVQYLREGQLRVIDTREHKYQFQFNLHIDDYAGYMSITHNFENRMASSFTFYDDFAGGPRDNFTWLTQQVIPVINSASKFEIEPLGAFASILFSYGAHQYGCIHGAFPYQDFKKMKEDHPLTYDKLSDIYTWIFTDLDNAIMVLEKYQLNPDDKMDLLIEKTDMASGASGAKSIVTQWLKFANSLRLRMAMNLVKVDDYTCNGQTPQQIAEDAVRRGVLLAGDPTFGIRPDMVPEAINHPLFKISNNWDDTRLNATLESILKRTQSPMLERWFNKNLSNLKNVNNRPALEKGTEFIGIRSGVELLHRSFDRSYKQFSNLNDYVMKDPVCWFKSEEVLFLRAEGALRDWNMGGSAEEFYKAGVWESFSKNAQSPDDYNTYMTYRGMGDDAISPEDRNKMAYKDYYDPYNDIPRWDGYYMLNNGWETVATNPYTQPVDERQRKEILLEKIITQKWISIFPMSLVAWTDYRRTGYPKILPAADYAYGDADGSITEDIIDWSTGQTLNKGLYIRRIPYCTRGDNAVRNEIAATGLDALGEGLKQLPDRQGTRIWWDIDKPNF